MNSRNGTKVLVRTRKGRMAGGVWTRRLLRRRRHLGPGDPRVITGGAGVLAYLAAWAIIPEEGYSYVLKHAIRMS